jgi:hypothetical protein
MGRSSDNNKLKNSLDKSSSQGKYKLYNIFKDYSEHSTIQGVIYIFQTNQTQVGKVFWSIVIIAMIILGTYWSICAYQDWKENPVVTTIKTSALPIREISFPAVTICGQGMNSDIVTAGTLKLKETILINVHLKQSYFDCKTIIFFYYLAKSFLF